MVRALQPRRITPAITQQAEHNHIPDQKGENELHHSTLPPSQPTGSRAPGDLSIQRRNLWFPSRNQLSSETISWHQGSPGRGHLGMPPAPTWPQFPFPGWSAMLHGEASVKGAGGRCKQQWGANSPGMKWTQERTLETKPLWLEKNLRNHVHYQKKKKKKKGVAAGPSIISH